MTSQWLNICQGECSEQPESPAISFPFELDDFQKHAVYCISKDENVLVTAPTGAGKTCVCIYAMAHSLRKGKKVIYTSPIKSLSNQKFKEFKEKPEISDVGIMTGDIKFNPDGQCLIMTTEILRNLLYRDGKVSKDSGVDQGSSKPDSNESSQPEPQASESLVPKLNIDLDEIDCVIFDEVHYINDRDRGKVWEETIVMLPPRITLVMLSATIDKPERFASWIGDLKKQPIHLVSTSFRPVPLRHWVYVEKEHNDHKSGQLFEIMNEKNQFQDANFDAGFKTYRDKYRDPATGKPKKLKGRSSQQTNILMGQMKVESHELNGFLTFLQQRQLFPALVFVFSRKNCEVYASSIRISVISSEERAEIGKIFNHHMHPYLKQYEQMGQFQAVRSLLDKGIAVHHSGLVPILKEIIEILFSKGLIKILFCTETFAVGVNMPTKTVVFTEMEKFDGYLGRRRLMKTDEYLQMAGRAGRRGLDKIGTVVHFPIRELPTKNELKGTMTGRTPEIHSKFTLNYQFILKVIQSEHHDLLAFIESSLLNEEQGRMIEGQRKELAERYKVLDSAERSGNPGEMSITPELAKRIKEYQEIQAALNSGFTIKQKQMKKYKKRLHELSDNNSTKFQKAYEQVQAQKERERTLQDLEQNIKYLESQNIYALQCILDFLLDLGYLKPDVASDRDSPFAPEVIKQLGPGYLQLKGLLGAQISECNEILLTEILFKCLLDDLELPELAAVLATFIEDSTSEDDFSIQSLELPSGLKNTFEQISKISEDLDFKEERYGIKPYLQTDWKVYLEFATPAYLWTKGEGLGVIYQTCELYEGNFIRGMLKISHMAETLVTLAEMAGNPGLAKKAETLSKQLIRDEVTVNSLYVN